MKTSFAVFRADANASMGSGHIMRCLTLAASLKESGWQCAFAVNREAHDVVPALATRGFPIVFVQSSSDIQSDARHLMRQFDEGCDLLVVDHYEYNITFETECRGWTRCVVVLDDLADRNHDCDFLIDQTFGRAAAEYKPYVPTKCHILAGADYALLRSEFRQLRNRSLKRRQTEDPLAKVLVTMGGTDPKNATSIVLNGIAGFSDKLAVDVVLGPGSPHIDAVKAQTRHLGSQVKIKVGANNMAVRMARADFCFGAAGSTAWERCCLGLPSAIVIVADNQIRIAEELDKSGAVINLGKLAKLKPSHIADALNNLSKTPTHLQDMSARAAEICDGLGSERITDIIAP